MPGASCDAHPPWAKGGFAWRAPDPWVAGDLARWLMLAGEPVASLAPRELAKPYRLAVQGRWSRAAAAWEELGNRLEGALARLNADDQGEVRVAHDLLSSIGAKAAAACAARCLAEFGAPVPRGPRRTTELHPAKLTVREAEIADLIAEGLSNREIAVRLVLSDKTVGHHASAILAKLGVRRRAEVARALARSGAA